ncbi:hypothetical protein [Polynucleobacter sp. es-MAR-4]|uniref:hypothetical protein n=1 Tax=Polynucleobacter sp. es-MAR-4 TaxID=1855655 RepID=UPI001C0DF9EF|nr:hypothetical protein [Polynucleobacter sp. es-MAR-4]
MNSIKRIARKNCGAHILGDRPLCSVCLAPKPKEPLNAKRLSFSFVALKASAIAYWLSTHDD